ncbi:MAG: hypothetical protein WCK36_02140 [Candidatus Firestonebacteria bacterium]
MKNLVLLFVAAAFMFVFSGKVFAEKTEKPGKTGVVTSIQDSKESFSIKRIGDDKPFTFECKAEVIKGIKVGDKVDVWYKKESGDDKRVASKVKIAGGEKDSEKKEETKKEGKKKGHSEK